MNQRLLCTAIACIFTLGLLVPTANAALKSVDWKVRYDGLITRDTNTSLDWLDLTETSNLSYNYVSGQLGAGGAFEGFRYATYSETVNLFAEFGIDTSAQNWDSNIIEPSVELMTEFVGDTMFDFWSGSYPGFRGLISGTEITPGDHPYLTAWMDIENGTTSVNISQELLFSDASIHPTVGSFLVRTSVVPIPATVWLFGSGLIGLFGLAKRKTA